MTNTYDTAVVESYIRRLESLDDAVLSAKGRYMQEVRVIREDKLDVLAEADTKGINRKALKAHLKERRLEHQLDAVREDLDDEGRDALDAIRQALGIAYEDETSAPAQEPIYRMDHEVSAKKAENARQRAATKAVDERNGVGGKGKKAKAPPAEVDEIVADESSPF